MKLFFQFIILSTLLISSTFSYAVDPTNIYPKVKLQTSMGVIVVELDRVKAPITVDNFLEYVVKGEYDNTIFHRIIEDFIVQGGAYDAKFTAKKLGKNIINESGNGLKNEMGTIAMAKENRPHTANRQFFFNLADNTTLDPGRKWGYAVFGAIVEGEEVLTAIAKVPTDYNEEMAWNDVPLKPVMLIKATLLPADN
ncbi:MAG: peptidylprolyl isomerase [Colwellia sp.]|uniref:peptidylprolyl isomerase n=1 Tax=Colwellia sp. TaxID=56799 RepID=UPI001E138839|nr:peptidylprolyl isomerase [Colwellia sp.]NQY50329.1 peptidylprolyl isomerase [Colwellia sp.]